MEAVDLSDSSQNFCTKLYSMVTNENPQIIGFRPDGVSFEVRDPARLEREILPKYFRHRRFQSLVRQLNFYCFKKLNKERNSFAYQHENFQYGHPELLVKLQRKRAASAYAHDHPHPRYQPAASVRTAPAPSSASVPAFVAGTSSSSPSPSPYSAASSVPIPHSASYSNLYSSLSHPDAYGDDGEREREMGSCQSVPAASLPPAVAGYMYSTNRSVNREISGDTDGENEADDDEGDGPSQQHLDLHFSSRALCALGPSRSGASARQPRGASSSGAVSSTPNSADVVPSVHSWGMATRFFSPQAPVELQSHTVGLSSSTKRRQALKKALHARLSSGAGSRDCNSMPPAVESVVDFCLSRNPFANSEDLYSEVAGLLAKDPRVAHEVGAYLEALTGVNISLGGYYSHCPPGGSDRVQEDAMHTRLSLHVDGNRGVNGSSTGSSNGSTDRSWEVSSETDSSRGSREGGGETGEGSVDSEEEGSLRSNQSRRRVTIVLGANAKSICLAGKRERDDADGGNKQNLEPSAKMMRTRSLLDTSTAALAKPLPAVLSGSEVVLMRTFMSFALASLQDVSDAAQEQPDLSRTLGACSACWTEYAKIYS